MKLLAVRGDITLIVADAIVNAANTTLLGGGGVDGAIHKAGGPAILEECRRIVSRQGGCPTGEAVITTAGRLPAHYVIHTVGPIWDPASAEEMDRLLANCYRSSLEVAYRHHCRTVAFPNLSTGAYRFPKDRAARVAVSAVRAAPASGVAEVSFVCFDQENYDHYVELLSVG